MRWRPLVLVLGVALAACGEDAPPSMSTNDRVDAGLEPDARATNDAAVSDTAVVADPDAEVVTDPDASPPPDDAATPDPDASAPPADASAPPPDGGVRPMGSQVGMSPRTATVALGGTLRFEVDLPAGAAPDWDVDGIPGGDARVGRIVPEADARFAVYSAPMAAPFIPDVHQVHAAVPGSYGSSDVTLFHAEPRLTAISPDAVPAGSSTVTIALTGSGFDADSEVQLDGVPVETRVNGWTSLDAELPPSLLRQAGLHRLTVYTPPPGGGSATLELRVILGGDIVLPGVPAGVPALFDAAAVGSTPARLPAITYPEDGARAPFDFPAPVVSFTRPAPSNVCRVRLSGPAVQVDVYAATTTSTPRNANPSAALSPADWSRIVQTSFEALPLTITVACAEVTTAGGSPAIAGGTIYPSAPIRYTVARESAGGRIVYFSGLVEGLWRIDVGGNAARGVPWIGPDRTFRLQTPTCVGCHSFSRSGMRMTYAAQSPTAGWYLGVLAIQNETPTFAIPSATGAQAVWTTLSPDGTLALSVNLDKQLVLQNGMTGAQIAVVPTGPAGNEVSQPFWSPLGNAFAFTSGTEGLNGVTDMARGRLWTMTFSMNGTTPVFGPPVLLAEPDAAQGTAYYPAYSPDGQWIAFCRAPAGSSYHNEGAKLWVVKADRSVGPVLLGRANRTGNLTNSWPRWAPTAANGKYWISFNSQRPYPPLNGTGPQQLWVTSVDSSLFPQDPSSPAIWLPGQEPFTGNLTAEWTIAQ